MNFFDWIRHGVKQSVLLGVSDAVESIGTPTETDDFHPNMVALLQNDSDEKAKPKRKRAAATNSRKRLGKSLKEMDG